MRKTKDNSEISDSIAKFIAIAIISTVFFSIVEVLTFCFGFTLYKARLEKNACDIFRTNPLCVYKEVREGKELAVTPIVWIYDNKSQPLYGISIEKRASIRHWYPHSIPDYKVKRGDSLLIGTDNHKYVATAVKDGSLTYKSSNSNGIVFSTKTKAIYTFPNNVIDSMLENDDIDFIKFQHQSFTSKQKHPKTNEYVVIEKGWEQFGVGLREELRLKKGFRMLKEQVEKKTSSQNR